MLKKSFVAGCSKTTVARRKKSSRPKRIWHTQGFELFEATQPAGIFQQPVMSDPGICAQCASKQPTCCQIPPGQEESCFPLSPGERQKLERHNVFISGPRFAQSVNSKIFLRNLHRLFPQDEEILQRLFPQDRLHHRLALAANGRCAFLGPTGCVAPVEGRPYYCRMYPFWFVGKRFFKFAPTACLAVQTNLSPKGLCSLFNTNQSALQELYAQLRLSWGLDDTSKRG